VFDEPLESAEGTYFRLHMQKAYSFKVSRLAHTMGQGAVRSRTGKEHEHDVVCTRMSDSSDVEVYILAAVCEEIGKKIKKKSE
jgi:hypothetical protein